MPWKKIGIIGILVIVVTASYTLYQYNKTTASVNDTTSTATFTLDSLNACLTREPNYLQPYIHQVVSVQGVLTNVDTTNHLQPILTIRTISNSYLSAICSLDSSVSITHAVNTHLAIGKKITCKGYLSAINVDTLLGTDLLINKSIVLP